MEATSSGTAIPRRERERIARRTLIIDAARQVFAEKGFGAATLDQIAVRAEFGKGTIYNYFPDGKEELLLAVVADVYDRILELVERSFPNDDDVPSRERFEQFLESTLNLFTDDQALFAVLMKESYRMAFSEREDRVRHFMEQRGRVARALAIPIRRAMEKGEFRPFPPEAVAHVLLGNIQGCQTLLSLSDGCMHIGDAERPGSVAEAAHFLSVMLFDGLDLKVQSVDAQSEART